jgi:hypothetical protein
MAFHRPRFLVRCYERARGFGCINYTKQAANPVAKNEVPVKSIPGCSPARWLSNDTFLGDFAGQDSDIASFFNHLQRTIVQCKRRGDPMPGIKLRLVYASKY